MASEKPSFVAFIRNEHLLEHVKTLYLGSDIEQARREAAGVELRPGHAAMVKSLGVAVYWRTGEGQAWDHTEVQHTHVSSGSGDRCAECGMDLRNEIHVRI